jgi:hypothetical protein
MSSRHVALGFVCRCGTGLCRPTITPVTKGRRGLTCLLCGMQSAARSKERRLKYTRDLEQKVSQLQDEISHLRHRLDTETERNKRSEGA